MLPILGEDGGEADEVGITDDRGRVGKMRVDEVGGGEAGGGDKVGEVGGTFDSGKDVGCTSTSR